MGKRSGKRLNVVLQEKNIYHFISLFFSFVCGGFVLSLQDDHLLNHSMTKNKAGVRFLFKIDLKAGNSRIRRARRWTRRPIVVDPRCPAPTGLTSRASGRPARTTWSDHLGSPTGRRQVSPVNPTCRPTDIDLISSTQSIVTEIGR